MSAHNETPELAEVLGEAIRARLLDVHTCLPARIEKYDASQQKADVQPLLKTKYMSDIQAINLPVITNVPVQWLSSNNGKAHIHLPLKDGDLGIVLFSERSLDSWLEGKGEITTPDDIRHHDLSDGIFIPGVQPFGAPLTNVPADNLVIQNDKFRIELAPDGTISLEGVSEELITILDDLLTFFISDARVLTVLGPQPFIADSIAKLQVIQTRLRTIKRL